MDNYLEFINMQGFLEEWENSGLSKEEQLDRIKVYINQSVDFYSQVNKIYEGSNVKAKAERTLY
jgi:hypothetical protein